MMDHQELTAADQAALERMWVEERQKVLSEADRRMRQYLAGLVSGGKLQASKLSGTVSTSNLPGLLVKEADGTPSVSGVYTLIVSNGTLANDGGGTVTVTTGGSALTVAETDGTPSVSNVSKILVSNSTLTDDGGGTVTITTGGGGAPTTSQYILGATDGTLSNAHVIPRLKGDPDSPPASPHTEDDEFDSSSLNAKWTVVTNTAGSVDIDTTWRSHVFVNFTGAQTYSIKQSYAPSGDFSLTVCFRYAAQANFQGANLYVFDSTENNGVRAAAGFSAAAQYSANLSTRDSGTWTFVRSGLTVPFSGKFYVHLQRASTTWGVWYSDDGYTFWRIGTFSKSLTVDHLTVEVAQAGATVPVRAGWDWIRRDWVTL